MQWFLTFKPEDEWWPAWQLNLFYSLTFSSIGGSWTTQTEETIYWRIQDFPGGGDNPRGGGKNLLFGQFFVKIPWKRKKLDRGGAPHWRPVGSANAVVVIKVGLALLISFLSVLIRWIFLVRLISWSYFNNHHLGMITADFKSFDNRLLEINYASKWIYLHWTNCSYFHYKLCS